MLNNKPVILIFSDWYVPGYKAGGPIQSVYNLSKLLSKNFVIKIITRNIDYQSEQEYPHIIANQWIEIEPNHWVFYCSKNQLNAKFIKQQVKENKNNKVLLNGVFSFYFSILPLYYSFIFGYNNIVLAARGMLHRSALSIKPAKKQIFLAFARGFGLFKNVVFLSSSMEETKQIRNALGNKLTIKEVANIPLLVADNFEAKTQFKSNNRLNALFLGRIAPEKNPMVVIEALKMFTNPLKITFCGSFYQKEYFNEFIQNSKLLPKNITFEYIESLPHSDIELLFAKNDVMILPSLGENFGHAIFESFSYATPVIIGNNTPWKNLKSNKVGLEINPTDKMEVLEALNFYDTMDEETYKAWQLSAFGFAKDYFINNNFEEMYNKLFS